MKLRVRQLEEGDLDEADRILRLAFDTFLGLKPPTSNFGDRDLIRTRWRADPNATFAVELDGRLIGSNFRDQLGFSGVLWPAFRAPGILEQGNRQPTARTDNGTVREVAKPSCRALHIREQPSARGTVPEVRFLAPLHHCDHVEDAGEKPNLAVLAILGNFHTGAAGAYFSMRKADRQDISGARPAS